MKRAMMFPFPGNYGPLVNCCAIADQLHRLGYDVGFSSTGYYVDFIDHEKYSLWPTAAPPWVSEGKATLKSKPFTRIQSLDTFVRFFGFSDYAWLKTYISSQIQAVKEFAPDVLIGSWDFTLGMTGELLNIPVVSVFQEPMHPSSRGFEWWNPEASPDSLPQSNLAVFNALLRSLGLQPVDKIEEVISRGDLLVMPSLPELEPVAVDDSRICYVGYMEWGGRRAADSYEWVRQLETSRGPLIYVYDHGLSYGLRTLKAVIDLYADTYTTVVVSVGLDTNLDLYPPAPRNLQYHRFVPQAAILRRAEAAITHGPVGSVMSCVHYNTPNVSVPTHSEREYYARRIAAIQAGEMINIAEVSADSLQRAIDLATSKATRSNLQALCKRSHELGGALKAAQLIDALVR